MDDSVRFADQSKALWLHQHNTMNGSGDFLDIKKKSRQSQLSTGALSYGKSGAGSTSCIGRCPFATIIATIITVCGTGVFCGCLYRALTITFQMLAASFKIEMEMEPMRFIQTLVIVVSAVMGSLAIMLLVVGCLSTGATRRQVFTGFRSRLGGRISIGFFTVLVYLLFLIWLVVTIGLVVPIIAYYVVMKNCEVKSTQINTHLSHKEDECLSLKTFGITLTQNKLSVCSHELITFCNQAKEAGPLYIAAFISSALIVIGLVHYLCCLVANYAHIKDGIKLKDYEEAIKEELDLRCELAAANRKRADL